MTIPFLLALVLNPVETENAFPGTQEWMRGMFAPGRIDGFVSATSVKAGDSLRVFVKNTLPKYRVEFYRLGWYGGLGARLVHQSGGLPRSIQPDCLYDAQFRSTSCHNWNEVFALTIPDDWLSGLYWVRFAETEGASTWFTSAALVVRDDESSSDFILQVPFNRHQMYNAYGGRAWHYGPGGFEDRSLKVSFDRPADRGWPLALTFDYPLIRWLERNGYWVTYSASDDTHSRPDLMLHHRAWLLPGHDEFWTKEIRDNIEAARDTGVHIAHLGGCSGYRQVRVQDSPIGPRRVLLHYYFAALDPLFTGEGGTERDPERTAVAFREHPVNRPENALFGVMYTEGQSTNPAQNFPWRPVGRFDHWLFEGTNLAVGDLIAGVVAHEYDRVVDNGFTPEGLLVMSHSPACNTVSGICGVSNTVLHRASSGALVFGGATVQWPNALDRFFAPCGAECPPVDARFERITHNLLRHLRDNPATTPQAP